MIAALLDERAARGPTDPALVSVDEEVTWARLRDRVGRVAAVLAARPGEMVPFSASPDADAVVQLLALLARGAVPLLVHPRWPPSLAAEAVAPFQGQSLGALVDEPATVLFTSGSTSRPKAVVHRLGQHRASAAASDERTPFGPGHRWLLALPLCHVGGLSLIFRALHRGGCVALCPPGLKGWAAVRRLRPTHLSLVAPQLADLLDDEGGAALEPGLDAILVGGGPVPAPLRSRARSAGLPVRPTWGMTEAASQVCTAASLDDAHCGPPLPGWEVRTEADGELAVRGPALFEGYLGRADDELVLDRARSIDGWFRTGDLGRLGDEGVVEVTGRRDNMFISGGENVSPELVEGALQGAPGVRAVVVVDIPSPRWGARPFAFYEAARGARDVEAELRRAAEERLPRFLRPEGYAPLPPGPEGKAPRGALRALARSSISAG